MNLSVIYPKSEDCADFDMMCASGDPPEIFIDWPDMTRDVNDATLMPYDLTPTIEKYGPNLSRIPDSCWDWGRIGSRTISIPTVVLNTSGLMANTRVLEALGSKLPTTMEEMEELMGRAQAEKYKPFDTAVVSLWYWFGLNGGLSSLYHDEKGQLRSICDSPGFLSLVTTERRWKERGWCYQEQGKQTGSSQQDKWLFTAAAPYYRGDADAVAVPPLPAAPGGPSYPGAVGSSGELLSYHTPEALVTLVDWMMMSESNYNLIYLGQEGEDYEWVDGVVYRTLNNTQYTHEDSRNLSMYFQMDGIYPRHREQGESAAMFQIENDQIAYAREYTKPSRYDSLPLISGLYARENSRLKAAWQGMNAYTQAVMDARWRYVAGEISLDEFAALKAEKENLIKDYITLTQAYIDGKYDPASDMYSPRVAP